MSNSLTITVYAKRYIPQLYNDYIMLEYGTLIAINITYV